MSSGQKEDVAGLILHEYIGTLSQEFLCCSYNEDDIRQMWRNGTLDDYTQHRVETEPSVIRRLQGHYRVDGRYADVLTFLVKRAGGWTPNWGEETVPLTREEQAKVDAFTLTADDLNAEETPVCAK